MEKKSNRAYHLRPLLVLYCLMASFLSQSFAAELSNSKTQLFLFAENLFADSEYYRAITEYLRFLSYYPGDEKKGQAELRIFDCYFLGKHYQEALAWGRKIRQSHSLRDSISAQIDLKLGNVLLAMGDFSSSRSYFEQAVTSNTINTELTGRGYYSIGYTYLMESKWQEAAASFAKVPPGSTLAEDAGYASSKCLGGSVLPGKNPALAGVLSIIPGMGYFYIGHTQSGLSSLVLNAIFGAATYSAFEKRATGLGVLLGFVSLSYYSGSIYGSVIGAYRFNQRRKQEFLGEFYSPISLEESSKQPP